MTALPRSFRKQAELQGQLLSLRASRRLLGSERDLLGELEVAAAHRRHCKETRLATARAMMERTMTDSRAFHPEPVEGPATGEARRQAPPDHVLPPSGPAAHTNSSPERGGGPAQPVEGFAPHARAANALADVARLRRDQAELHGHTAAADDARDLADFGRTLQRLALDVVEDLQFNKRLLARRHAVKLAAFAVALADRLDRDFARAQS